MDDDEKIEAFHRGWDTHKRGDPRPVDPVEADGWDDRARAVQVRVVMPARPEGYYHTRPDGEF